MDESPHTPDAISVAWGTVCPRRTAMKNAIKKVNKINKVYALPITNFDICFALSPDSNKKYIAGNRVNGNDQKIFPNLGLKDVVMYDIPETATPPVRNAANNLSFSITTPVVCI